jgi:hypothetical protein
MLIYHCPIFILYFLFLFSYFYSQTNAAKTSVFMNKIIIFITKKFFDIACWINIFFNLVENPNKSGAKERIQPLVCLKFLLYEFIINNACGAALIFWFFIIFPIFYIFIIKLTIIQFNNWFSFTLLFFNFLIFFIGLLGIVSLIIAQFCKKDFNSIKGQGIQFEEKDKDKDKETQSTEPNEGSAKKRKFFF